MGCALNEVRNFKGYVAGFGVSPTGRCSDLEGLRIYSKSSDHLELANKELRKASDCFRGVISVISSAYSRWSIIRLSIKSLT